MTRSVKNGVMDDFGFTIQQHKHTTKYNLKMEHNLQFNNYFLNISNTNNNLLLYKTN